MTIEILINHNKRKNTHSKEEDKIKVTWNICIHQNLLVETS